MRVGHLGGGLEGAALVQAAHGGVLAALEVQSGKRAVGEEAEQCVVCGVVVR